MNTAAAHQPRSGHTPSARQQPLARMTAEQHVKKRFYIRMLRIRQRMGIFWPILLNSAVLAVIFLFGSMGYHYIEGWPVFDGFYMVLITLSTIGFGEVYPLSQAGKWLTVGVIISGVVYFALLIGYFVQLASDGRVFQMMRRRRVDKAISALSGHCVLCGYGLVGRVVAAELAADGVDVVVVETDEKKTEEVESAGYFLVLGDATSDDVMTRVGLGHAKALVASMSNDPANVYVVLSARAMNPDLYIVARASDNRHISKLQTAGANRVVLPHLIGGQSIAQAIQRPLVESFMHRHNSNDEVLLDEFLVSAASPLVGKNLAESALTRTHDVIIIAIKNPASPILQKTRADTVVQAGDVLLVAGAKANLESLNELM
jgi:voltage-gated potassium channel